MFDSIYKRRYTTAPMTTYKSDDGEKTQFHWHEEIEIIYVEKGSVKASVSGDSFVADTGDFIFVNPREIHSYEPIAKQYTYYCVCADYTMIADKEVSGALSNRDTAVLHHIKHGSTLSKSILPKFLELYKVAEKKNDTRYLEGSAYLSLIFADIMKNNALLKRSEEKKTERFCRTVLERIEENYKNEISSKELATELFYTHSYFCRFFAKNFGMPFSVFMREFRVYKAKELLKNQSVKISEISAECGFSSPEYFAKTFKKIIGVSPREYRENVLYLKPKE